MVGNSSCWFRRQDSRSGIPSLRQPASSANSSLPAGAGWGYVSDFPGLGEEDIKLPGALGVTCLRHPHLPVPFMAKINFLPALLPGKDQDLCSCDHQVGPGKPRGNRPLKEKCCVCLLRCLWKAGPASRQNMSPASLGRASTCSALKKCGHQALLQTFVGSSRGCPGDLLCRQGGELLHKSHLSPLLACFKIPSGQVWKPTGLLGTGLRCYPLFFLACGCWLLPTPVALSPSYCGFPGIRVCLHLLFPSSCSFIPPSLEPWPHSAAQPRLYVMWIRGDNQPVIPLWFPSVAFAWAGPGRLLPLAGVCRDCEITATESQPLLGPQSHCHKKRVSFTQWPETKQSVGVVATVLLPAGRLAGVQAVSVCWAALSRAFNT